MKKQNYSWENWRSKRWYKNRSFSLVPVFCNDKGILPCAWAFRWLFFRIRSEKHWFQVSIEFVVEHDFGIGIRGVLPFINYGISIPFGGKIENWYLGKIYTKRKDEQAQKES